MGVERINAASEADYTVKAVDFIAARITGFQSSRPGNFVLGLSGTNGQVRRARAAEVFAALGKNPDIDWTRVLIFLVEERYGCEREDSNAHLVKANLMAQLEERGVSMPSGHFVAPNTDLGWVESAKDYGERLRAVFKRHGPPNLVTLSMGFDYSVASIFPEWYQADPDRWAQATAREFGVLPTETTQFELPQRLSVNLRVLRAADTILVFLGAQGASETWCRSSSGAGAQEAWSPSHREAASPRESAATPRSPAASSSLHRVHLKKSLSLAEDLLADEEEPMKPRTTTHGGHGDLLHRRTAPDGSPTWRAFGRDAFSTSAGISKDPVADFSKPPTSPLSYVMSHAYIAILQLREDTVNHTSVVVFGAGGDLAKKKTLPALFHLYLARSLPTSLHIVCCDDTAYHKDLTSVNDLWNLRLKEHLKNDGRAADFEDFRKHLVFVPIKLDSDAAMKALDDKLRELSAKLRDNRVFYLAQPPFLFEKSVRAIRQHCWSEPAGWVRVIVEKPFGRDLSSAQELSSKLSAHLQEQQIYRIDHYLAKTMVLNILTLRFANREMGRLFHSDNVANVRITFKEDIGVEGRAGYFDGYGIIRDVMQNHLLQLLTLVTMEAPASLGAEDVRNEKVKVLKQIRPVEIEDCVVGQYEGYQEDPDIVRLNEQRGYKTRCPTFSTCVLFLDNERWSGVPLILKAGKNIDTRSTIVRLQFKKAPPNSLFGDQPQNELVMRVQPQEAIYYRMLAKTPGLTARAHEVRRTRLDLDLRKLDVGRPPEAYEKLIHDVIQGEGHNFVRADEVEEGWRIFDPLLKHLESPQAPVPHSYAVGSRGPEEADVLINSTGFRRYSRTGVAGLAQDNFQ